MRIDPIRLVVLVAVGSALYLVLSIQYNPAMAKTILLGYGLLCFKFYEALEPIGDVVETSRA